MFEANLIDEKSNWSRCCFNHYVGMPYKQGFYHPVYDYQLKILKKIVNGEVKRVAWLSSRGSGKTDISERFIAWLCTSTFDLWKSYVLLIAGTHKVHAVEIMDHLKEFFLNRFDLDFPYNEDSLYINDITIKSMPTKNPDAYRGKKNASIIYVDEAGFLPLSIQRDVKDALQAYYTKSDPIMLFTSSANKPYGIYWDLFVTQRTNPDKFFYTYETNVYDALPLYDPLAVEKLKRLEPETFFRELMNHFGYGSGVIFSETVINSIKYYGEKFRVPKYYPPYISDYTQKVMMLDPAFGGTSYYGIVIIEYLKNYDMIRPIYTVKKLRSTYEEMIDLSYELYNIFKPVCVYVDIHHQAVIRSLRKLLREKYLPEDVERIEKRAKENKLPYEHYWIVNGLLASNHKIDHLDNAESIIGIEGKFGIDPLAFPDLLSDIMTATKKDGKLVKQNQDNKTMDLMDCLTGCLWFYRNR